MFVNDTSLSMDNPLLIIVPSNVKLVALISFAFMLWITFSELTSILLLKEASLETVNISENMASC